MSSRKRKNGRKKKKKLLMGVENQWLIEDNLISVYSHLVESYSEQLREEWKVKDEVKIEVKQEVEDESYSSHKIGSTNPQKVISIAVSFYNLYIYNNVPFWSCKPKKPKI